MSSNGVSSGPPVMPMPIPVKITDFVPYPEFDDPKFYETILSKKEFYKTKTSKDFLDQKIEDVCNPNQFNLQSYQEFLRNYMSTSTPYNSILAFWGVGTGKCNDEEAEVYINGDIMKIKDVWDKYSSDTLDHDTDGGLWSQPMEPLYVNSLDQNTGCITEYPINRLYKQRINEKINVIELENGQILKITKNHQLLTESGWSNDFQSNSYVSTPSVIINQSNIKPIGRDLAYFLAYHMSNGIETNNGLYFKSNDHLILTKLKYSFIKIAEAYQFDIISLKQKNGSLKIECIDYINYLCVNKNYQWGNKNYQFPKIIMKAQLDEIKLFLSQYLTNVCYLSSNNQNLNVYLKSETSVIQLQHLLKLLRVHSSFKTINEKIHILYLSHRHLINFEKNIGLNNHELKKKLRSICKSKCTNNLSHPIQKLNRFIYDLLLDLNQRFNLDIKLLSANHNLENINQMLATLRHLPETEIICNRLQQLKLSIDNDLSLIKIKSVHEEDYLGYVYDFEITGHQNYVANHTICHNTCAAIQVAEGLKETAKKLGRKVYIIAKKQVRPNFWKELYSLKREKEESIPGSKQCTGSTYYVSKKEEKDEAKRERKIKNKIKQYYDFFGVQSFANYVDFVIKKEYPNLGDFFSDSVFIIDEAHGLTGAAKLKTTGKTKKKGDGDAEEKGSSKNAKGKKITERGILTVLQEIFRSSTGIKLVMLTATPMKDNETELVDLLDLMLINDKRPPVDKKKLFPVENKFNEAYLKELTKGYISYVRGENPVTFPQIVGPNPATLDLPEPKLFKPSPVYQENGEPLDAKEHMRYTSLVRCPMSVYQYSNYRKAINNPNAKLGKKAESIDLVGRQASNIIFPTSSNPNTGQHGNEGFKNAFEEYIDPAPPIAYGKTKSGKPLYKKKSNQYKYKDFNEGFLALDKIGKYSTKYETYLKNVINSKGIVYTYSDFVDVGARIIALMLEENGYVRYKPLNKVGAQNLLYKEESKRKYRCAKCGLLKDDPIHFPAPTNNKFHKFVQATYVLFTGDESKYSTEEINVVNSDENIDGHLIKIIVGTRVSGEGVDYKRLRQVHIIDPWHNNTRLYQVIGRAARHCSHKDLPIDERKVVVFKYCSSAPQIYFDYIKQLQNLINTGLMTAPVPLSGQPGIPFTFRELFTETSDERVYRRIEDKDVFVKQIERILKMVSVDCALNKNVNIFPTDVNGTRECDYTDCQYTCEGGVDSIDESKMKINLDTYNLHFSEPQINRAMKIIFDLFKYNFVMDLANIIKLIQQRMSDIEVEYINEALDRIVGHAPYRAPIPVIDRYDRSGHVIFSNPYYVFQPDDLDDNQAPLYYRTTPLTIKKKFVNLDSLKSEAMAQLPQMQQIIGESKTGPNNDELAAQALQNIVLTTNKYQIDAILDRLFPAVQEKIFEQVAHSTKYSPMVINTVINYFNKLDKLYVFQSINKPPQYLGHKINLTVRLYDTTTHTWKTVDENNPQIVNMKAYMAAKTVIKVPKKSSILYGYLIYDAKNKKYSFKLVAVAKQVLKATKPVYKGSGVIQDISKKSKVTGKVCSDFAADDLSKYSAQLGLTDAQIKGLKKADLCQLMELRLRELDDTDPDTKWFYNVNESVNL